jgi:hypothetical protein
MLDQQMWCWGQDIRLSEGNALIRYGFERHPVAPGISGSNGYARRDEAGRLLALWGSGLYLGAPGLGGVALRRFDFRPAYTRRPTLLPSELSGGAVPTFRAPAELPGPAREAALVGEILDAIVSYERWALDELGLDHRRRCVAAWRKACVTAEEMAPAWESLARRWRAIGIRAAG